MKAVILAGGYGTRLSEETDIKPKPMIEIGGYPILWHIMKLYSHYGIFEFIICLGYKGYVIKEYFANYFLHHSDVTFDMSNNDIQIHDNSCEPWKVTLVNTGEKTMTGGRLKRVQRYVGNETFCFTYGDGVGDVNISELIKFHKSQNVSATLTAIIPTARFGSVKLSENKVVDFKEKVGGNNNWVNGGFFVLEPKVFDLIGGDKDAWEIDQLNILAKNRDLAAFKHIGFWHPMDTLRDKVKLNQLWESGDAPWKVW